ncbi:MAG: AAA family ATPase [Bryobacteraceae bacterium]
MPLIEGFRVENYRVLRDVTLGKLWNLQRAAPLTPLVVVIGKNGSGKSTLFDAFGFLKDCLETSVEEACDRKQRGGYEKLQSAGQADPIRFEIYYRENPGDRPITYELTIRKDAGGRPYVAEERLRQRRSGQKWGWPYSFLWIQDGQGWAWAGEENLSPAKTMPDKAEEAGSIRVQLNDKRRLGIATLGQLRDHPRIARFRGFLEGWYLSYFTPDAARSLPMAGPQKHLNLHGDNLGNVVQFMERDFPGRFQAILRRIAGRIPGVRSIDVKKTDDGRVLLRFNDGSFEDPFFAQQVSDGTLKVFAYLLLLEDPDPPPFLCIEEPENGLYHKLLETLANEFREHATGKKKASQIFVTTHQPYFVNALEPKEVWVLEKASDGFAGVRRASDDTVVDELVKEGLPLGNLWYSDYLDPR